MRRVLSLFLPWWSAERVRRRTPHSARDARSHATILLRVRAGQQIVAGVDAIAHAAGVREGISLAQARTLLANIHPSTADLDEPGDAAALLALARWAARRWAPIVSPDPPDGLLLDISGCAHLFDGEQHLLTSLQHAVHALGFTPRAAIASTIGAAWALARFADPEDQIAHPGHERRAIAPLPTAALRLEHDAIESLLEVGIERVGQLLDLPRHALPSRYGHDLLLRIDQALGLLPEMVERTTEALDITASRELQGGTTRLETIERVLTILLAHVATSLASNESGLRRLDATFTRMNADPQTLTIQLSRPTRDDKHLWSLLRPKVERLHMGFGVERVTLHARGIARLVHRQVSLAGESENAWQHDAEFAALLDTLASRLGRTNVLRAEPLESHRPEHAFRWRPFDEPSTQRRPRAAPSIYAPRPSRLIHPPCPVDTIALHPDGPVRRVRWMGHDHDILTSIGPERIAPEWWKAREPTRDYFRVQDQEGRWLWLFRENETARWFVHGDWS